MADYRAIWRLDDMRVGIAQIHELLDARSMTEVEGDWIVRSALERVFQVICEAARNVPEEWRAGYPEVPWRQVIDLGNELRHAYHRVNLRLLWNIYTNDLPTLEGTIGRMILQHGPVPERPEQTRQDPST